MAETYCGKTCAECTYKEHLQCSGCGNGPGKRYSASCELARCCQSKGHESCDTCGFMGSCGTLRGRENIPESRKRERELEQVRKDALARRSPVLGKWLWFLFWLIVPSSVASIMTQESVAEILPALYLPGQILSVVCSVVYGLILLRLGAEEDHYRKAAIYLLVSGAVNAVVTVISLFNEESAWTMIISIPAAVAALFGEYNEYMGHSSVLYYVDQELAEKWSKLWKWYIGTFGALLGSILVVIIAPILGLLVLLAAAIGILVVSILKLVYLYRTAKLFREYSET